MTFNWHLTAPWKRYKKKPVIIRATKMESPFRVETLEGMAHGKEGDYLIEGVLGELYPCDAKVFLQSYEEVKE